MPSYLRDTTVGTQAEGSIACAEAPDADWDALLMGSPQGHFQQSLGFADDDGNRIRYDYDENWHLIRNR